MEAANQNSFKETLILKLIRWENPKAEELNLLGKLIAKFTNPDATEWDMMSVEQKTELEQAIHYMDNEKGIPDEDVWAKVDQILIS